MKQHRSGENFDVWYEKPKRKYDYNKTWQCKKCKQDFETFVMLKNHRRAMHAPKELKPEDPYTFDHIQEIFVCCTCSAEFQEEHEAKEHVKIHEDTFQCQICEEKFPRAYNYATHMITHTDDKTLHCPLCSYQTPKRTGLLIHINYKHLRKFYYACQTCGKGFNDGVLYREHENEHKGVRPFVCVVCNKDFTYTRNLLTHQIRNHRVGIQGKLLPNQCQMCTKVFGKVATLEKHVRERHTKKDGPHEKKHLCDTCGKGFAQKNKLSVHYRVHTGVKPYVCKSCNKGFTKRDYLVMHERVHSGEKPYSCEYCGKCFSQGAPLRIHQRSHTGERPYVCEFCSSGFTSKGALNIHCKSCTGGV